MPKYRAGLIGCGRVGALFPDGERGPETHAGGYVQSDLSAYLACPGGGPGWFFWGLFGPCPLPFTL